MNRYIQIVYTEVFDGDIDRFNRTPDWITEDEQLVMAGRFAFALSQIE